MPTSLALIIADCATCKEQSRSFGSRTSSPVNWTCGFFVFARLSGVERN